MNSNTDRHLDEDQLIRAVVDETDLPAAVRSHLAECDQCRTGKQSFEQELVSLGQVAERLAPKPKKRIVLPAPKTKRTTLSFLDWRNLVAAAATVAAVLIVFWGTHIVRDISGQRAAERIAERREAQQLLTEVNMLVDNALPTFYLEISSDKDPNYDEEFYQFLIPPTNEKNVS